MQNTNVISKGSYSTFRFNDFVSVRQYLLIREQGKKYLFLCFVLPAAAAAAKSLQSCPTLLDPIDGSPPGSPVRGIHQARTLEWVAISFSNA